MRIITPLHICLLILPAIAAACTNIPATVDTASVDTASAEKGETQIEIRKNPVDGAEMVLVPPGEFLMGTATDAKHRGGNEMPQRTVYIDGFWIYRYTVTVGQFRRFTQQTGYRFDWDRREPSWGWIDDHPMVRVSWYDANAYAVWAGVSLPTEAQWEKAARGTDGRIYPWGNEWEPARCNNLTTGPFATSTVGSYPQGASPYGVEDMAGNVEEWCLEAYDAGYHKNTPAKNPVGPVSGKRRTARGGSWIYSGDDWNFRSAGRYSFDASLWFHYYGFRCATPAPGVKPEFVEPQAPPPLPDPLEMSDGRRVTTPEQWRERRREILELFRTNVYGIMPAGRPENLAFTVTDVTPDMMDGTAVRKQVKLTYEGPGGTGEFDLLLFIPQQAKRPVPAFLLICHRNASNIDPTRETRTPFWPAEEIVARGYAAVAFDARQVAPDRADGFSDGVYRVFGPFEAERPADAWGTIAAWAWGASRAMDYLETDADIDATRVAVIGHSRGGKAALWAGAEDERFALAISNNSGAGGAAMTREMRWGGIGAQIQYHPYWYCENYRQFVERISDLPVDQHMLIGLAAPRRVYVASGTLDSGQDPESEFRSVVEAEPVFTLLGVAGLGTHIMPRPEKPLHDGHIGYHIRTSGHELTLYDWQQYMDYADRWMKSNHK